MGDMATQRLRPKSTVNEMSNYRKDFFGVYNNSKVISVKEIKIPFVESMDCN